jgi:hypothetical protein
MFYLSIESKGRGAKEETRRKFDLATVSSLNTILSQKDEIIRLYETNQDALESFYKLKGFMNQYDPENLTSLLAFEDTLYLAMEKRKNQAKITDFFKKQ